MAQKTVSMILLFQDTTSFTPVDKHGAAMPHGQYMDGILGKALPGLLFHSIGNFFSRVKPTGYCYLVDRTKVAEIKGRCQTNVSTNDVLTAWFAELLGRTVDNIHMAVNLSSVQNFTD